MELSFPHWIKFLVLLTQNSAFPGSSLSLLPPQKTPLVVGSSTLKPFQGLSWPFFHLGFFPLGVQLPGEAQGIASHPCR